MLRAQPAGGQPRADDPHALIEATSVNALVAAWLQFMIRDWFSHGKSPHGQPVGDRSSPTDDDWPRQPDAHPAHAGRPDAARRCATASRRRSSTRARTGGTRSQIYGTAGASTRSSSAPGSGRQAARRAGRLAADPARQDRRQPDARSPGFWIGLAMLQTRVHARAQRGLRPAARGTIPTWSDEELFQRARLIIAALHRQDPHRRVDAGGHQPPDDGDRACAPTGSAWPASGSSDAFGRISAQRGDQRHPRLRRRSTTACRTR